MKWLCLMSCLLLGQALMWAQSGQYKVVCDRATRLIKIVPLEDRTAGHVPVQSGFPSREKAEEWVDSKFNSLECDPEKQLQENQNKALQNQRTSSIRQSRELAGAVPTGTRLNISYTVSNLDEILFLQGPKGTKGFSIGMEGMLGRKIYGVVGTVFHAYAGLLEKIPDAPEESAILMGLKVPILVGWRSPIEKRYAFAVEAGLGWQPLTIISNGNSTIQQRDPGGQQISWAVRGKAGARHVSVMLQYEQWVTDFFKNHEYQLALFSAGLCFEF